MNKVELGSTGLFVTPICIGTGPLGNMPETFGFSVSEDQAYSTLNRAFQSPINFLDTAPTYGNSEKIIGKVIQDQGLPEGFVLQTKVDRSLLGDFSGDQIRKSLEQSLKLLGLDYLPVVYIHDPEHTTTIENIMSANGALDVLKQYKKQGVIGHIGIAGGPIGMLMRYIETNEFEAVITHNRFNLLQRTAEPLLDMAAKKGMAVLNAAPFASGILADPANNRFAYQPATTQILDKVEKIRQICQKYGVSLRAAALQFSVRDPRVTSTIVGPITPEQVDDCVAILEEKIPDELYAEIDKFDFNPIIL